MGWSLVGEAVEQGRGLYRKGVGEKRVVRSDGCADLDGYGGAGVVVACQENASASSSIYSF